MTKETILATKNWSTEYPNYMAENEILDAMDEYAIAFGKWIQGCNYAPAIDDGKWQNQLPGENDIITTEELHSQFIEQQKYT